MRHAIGHKLATSPRSLQQQHNANSRGADQVAVDVHSHSIQLVKYMQRRCLWLRFRLVATCSGWHRQHSSSADILDKLWTTVIIEPLSRDELSQVKCVSAADVSSIQFYRICIRNAWSVLCCVKSSLQVARCKLMK